MIGILVRGCGWWLRGVPLVGMRSESLGTVESRRGALVEGGASCRLGRLSPSCRCLILHLDHVSSPRSSNPACGFPALGFRSRSCLRSREAALPHLQAFQAVALPQPLVREAHELPRTSPRASDTGTGAAACVCVDSGVRPDSPAPDRSSSPSRAALGSGVPPCCIPHRSAMNFQMGP